MSIEKKTIRNTRYYFIIFSFVIIFIQIFFGATSTPTTMTRASYNDFYNNIMSVFDYECAKMAMPLCSKISDAMKEVNKIIEHMKMFVVGLAGKSRKEAAGEIKLSGAWL